jgi:hypothetical protein
MSVVGEPERNEAERQANDARRDRGANDVQHLDVDGIQAFAQQKGQHVCISRPARVRVAAPCHLVHPSVQRKSARGTPVFSPKRVHGQEKRRLHRGFLLLDQARRRDTSVLRQKYFCRSRRRSVTLSYGSHDGTSVTIGQSQSKQLMRLENRQHCGRAIVMLRFFWRGEGSRLSPITRRRGSV